MNLVNLEYFLTNKKQNMDLNVLLSEKIETIFLLWLGAAYSKRHGFEKNAAIKMAAVRTFKPRLLPKSQSPFYLTPTLLKVP